MPVEIREIVMRARVTDDEAPAAGAAEPVDIDTLKRQILQACEARIRQELRRQAER